MAQTAVHLVDPRHPLRTCSAVGAAAANPAARPQLVTPVLQVVHRVLTPFLGIGNSNALFLTVAGLGRVLDPLGVATEAGAGR